MDIDKSGIYVGDETRPSHYKSGVVFPCFQDIRLDCLETVDVTHVFPNFSDMRATVQDAKVTVPLIVLGTEVGDRQTKFEDDLDEHVLPKLDLMPPMMCIKGFHEKDYVFTTVDVISDLMAMDIDDLVNCDISEHPSVVHYDEILLDKATYAPEARISTQANKGYNDFIIKNMVGDPVERVLDIGTGKGTTLTRLERLNRVGETTVIDCVEPNDELAAIASSTPMHSGAQFAVYNQTIGEFLGGANGKYDLIVANNSIHFAYDEMKTLDPLYNALQVGGEIIGAFPNYDSLVFRPSYGSVSAGLVRAELVDGTLMMETDISGVRRREPAFPYWKLIDDRFDVEFRTGSTENYREKEVMGCFATFKARKREKSCLNSFEVIEGIRSNGKDCLVRPGFRARKSGAPVGLQQCPVDFPVAHFSKGMALTWSEFFALRSMTFVVSSKTDGICAHVTYINDGWYLKMAGRTYRISTKCPRVDGIFQVEVVYSNKQWKLVLCEDQTTPLFINMFARRYPSFLYLKDYYPVSDVSSVRDLLIREKEGIIMRGCFSGTAYSHDVRNALHVKWDPTVDVLQGGKVVEKTLDGRVLRERPDKTEGNDFVSLAGVAFNMTPQAFFSVLTLPFDVLECDLPHKNLISYPFGNENFVERNSFVGMYLRGAIDGVHFSYPRDIVAQTVFAWDKELWKELQRIHPDQYDDTENEQ